MDRNIENYSDKTDALDALTIAESSEYCLKGWADKEHNRDGCCCCNCIHQQPIVGHPWNQRLMTKTSISTIIGWGCVTPELYPEIVMFDNSHGMCEMYMRKPMEVKNG